MQTAWMPAASSDWRFLPGIPAGGQAVVVSPTQPEGAVGLLAAFTQVVVVQEAKTAVLPPHLRENGRWQPLQATAMLSLAAGSFDLVALPHGFWQTPGGDLQRAWGWLRPGGVVYAGFNGRFHYRWWRKTAVGYTASHISHIMRELGFQVGEPHGLLPNVYQPALLAPVRAPAVAEFVGRKWPGLAPWLTGTVGQYMLSHLLPAYGLVGRKPVSSENR